VKAGLILPLDKYSKAYGWEQSFSPQSLQQFKWSPDGKTFGTGTLYGIAQSGQSTGVFANKAKLEVVERLGSESHVIFPVEAPALTGEAAVAADEATEEGDATLLAGDTPTRFTARVEGRRRLSPGDDAEFAIDPATIHLFDPETSLALR
jgi:ABC-type sugar transport system ATPase subunit